MVKLFVKQSSLQRFLIHWKVLKKPKPIAKIVLSNQFPGLHLNVDKLARVLSTWVNNLWLTVVVWVNSDISVEQSCVVS